MADVNEQIAQIKANSRMLIGTTIRQVQGGFVVNGQVQYQDKATGGIAFSENAEAVASSPEQAAQMSLNYLRSGNFDGTQQAAPVEDTAQTNMFGTGLSGAPSSI